MNRSKLIFGLKTAAVAVASAALIFALVYFNFIVKDPEHVTYAEGAKCPDFTAKTYLRDEEEITLSDYSGKVVVLNFWYTTCGPCVAEIPGFENVQKEFADDVEIFVIHRVNPSAGEVVEKINDMGWSDYSLTFLQDDFVLEFGKTSLYLAFGGRGAYPMTVIINREGRISTLRHGGMPETELRDRVLKAM